MAKASNKRRQRGTALVEMAFILTVLFMFLLGILNFGYMSYANNWVSYAAHDAARWASVRGTVSGRAVTETDIKNYVKGQLVALDSSKLTVSASGAGGLQGTTVVVTVTYSFPAIVPLVPQSATTLQSTSKMIISQ